MEKNEASIEPRVQQPNPTLIPTNPTSTSGLIKVLIGVVLTAAIVAGGWFAYAKFFAITPQQVLGNMQEALIESNSIAYQGVIKLNVTTDEGQESESIIPLPDLSELTIEYNGKSIIKDEKELSEASFKVIAEGDTIIALNLKAIDTITYFQITKLPSELSLFIDTSSLKKTWIKFDTAEFLNDSQGIEIDEFQEQMKELENKFKNIQLFDITKVLDDEIINEQKLYHYQVSINKDALQSIIEEIYALTEQPPFAMLEGLNLPPIDLWIGKSDFLPYKLSLNTTFQDLYLENEIFGENDSISINQTMSSYNQEFEITAPSESKTFEEVMKEVLGGGMFGTFSESEDIELETLNDEDLEVLISDTETDTDQDGLNDYEEVMKYHTDPQNADTDGDGFLDGDEVKQGFNPNGEGKLELDNSIDTIDTTNTIEDFKN